MLTTWDGYVRLGWLVESARLQVTLLTAERTIYRRLHRGLACAFVEDDASGPPAFAEFTLTGGLTDDVRILLGDRLATLVTSVVDAGRLSGAGRLNLVELEEIAGTWAPYRDRVLAPEAGPPRASVGSWARELWTWVAGRDLREAVGALAMTGEGFRRPGEVVWHSFTLPPEMAAAAGVEPELAWATYAEPEARGIVVRARVAGEVRLFAGLDDGSGRWIAFEPGDEADELLADLPLGESAGEPALRFRTGTEE
ncbi:hypothetical protein [Amycolatopsis australiensis]|uniref:Uncharacterized protein n=1 Tax=Amycolatopsis australiensis TaxID=546364 RepID=A0A1K1T6B7_9PSEU|nr:hypothetical protein [Amycolatopsis australiensis]SFW92114.1 hypothetical protein SAMN04489730_8392 [Amycolatopsis australiensis]